MTDNVGVFWSKDGSKLYIVGIGIIWEYALSVPFSYDYRTATYIGEQKLIKVIGGGTDKLTKPAK